MSQRFIDSSLTKIEIANRTPISGYLDYPLLPLEQTLVSVKLFVPSLTETILRAKELCNQTSRLITLDESAAIYLYTMQTSFFEKLNKALREENRQALIPWFPFIRLFMSALEKLPSINGTVWRGINTDIGSSYTESTKLTWWSFNSCSRFVNVVEAYIGTPGTLFAIECKNGKDISKFSAMYDEAEVVLMPGTRLNVTSVPFTKNHLQIFHIIEYERKEQDGVNKTNEINCENNELQLKIGRYRNNATVFFYNADLLNKNSTSLIADELKQNRTWQVLCLSFNKKIIIYDLVGAIADQSTLKELDLSGISIDERAASLLAQALQSNHCLTVLRLSYNALGDRGAIALAEMLRINLTLQRLFLARNDIQDEGCMALCDSLRRNTNLLYLYLDDNHITIQSLESIWYALHRNLTLEFLFLGANPIALDVHNQRAIMKAARHNDTCKVIF